MDDFRGPNSRDPIWMDHFKTLDGGSDGGIFVPATTPQPESDLNEPWSELPPLKKVSPAAVFELVEALRQAGVPVLGPKARRAGLLSGGKLNVTLSVPDRLRSQATLIVASHFPDQ